MNMPFHCPRCDFRGTGKVIEESEELVAGNEPRSEPHEMLVRHLAVDEDVSLRAKGRQRDLGGVRDAREHGLSTEHPTDRHAVESPGQDSVTPAFDRMGMTRRMEGEIRSLHLGGNPGLGTGARPRRRATPHDRLERGIPGDFELVTPQPAPQATRDTELGRDNHRSGIGRPPQNRPAFAVPRKYPAPVGMNEPLRVEVAAYREGAVSRGVPGVRKRDRGRTGRNPRRPPGGRLRSRIAEAAAPGRRPADVTRGTRGTSPRRGRPCSRCRPK